MGFNEERFDDNFWEYDTPIEEIYLEDSPKVNRMLDEIDEELEEHYGRGGIEKMRKDYNGEVRGNKASRSKRGRADDYKRARRNAERAKDEA